MTTQTGLPQLPIPYGSAKLTGLILGPLLCCLVLVTSPPEGLSVNGWNIIGCALLMMTWWITGAVPMPVTSLLPLVLFPLFGIFDLKHAAMPYASPSVYLYMGGFLIALTMEKWKLHIRIALGLLRMVGTHIDGMIGGFMIAAGLLSMWMSNTATVVMMLPIAMSVIELFCKDVVQEEGACHRVSTSILLGVAYGASIGGIATIVGTPPNTIAVAYLKETFNLHVSFTEWMMIGVPFMIIMFAATWLVLVKWLFPSKLGQVEGSKDLIETELQALGPMGREEKMVAGVFVVTALLWMSRVSVNALFDLSLTDEAIAMIAGITLFLIPVDLNHGKFLLDWKTAEKLPWGILLLFGGGLSLAHGLEHTGLIQWAGHQLYGLEFLSGFAMMLLVTFISIFITQFMGNMALVTIFLPMVSVLTTTFGHSLLMTCIPVTIAASCAFMLPISTPPNAIILAGGYIKIPDMMRAGFVLSLISYVVLMVLMYLLGPTVFGL